ncbi:hypothetical protein [Paraburkholderia sp. 35.1]|uniref:hypothetical protein n=1 Tax=Paraburkholderia sp. 35.1 TaxID=2991058 RepID=UPI003D258C34
MKPSVIGRSASTVAPQPESPDASPGSWHVLADERCEAWRDFVERNRLPAVDLHGQVRIAVGRLDQRQGIERIVVYRRAGEAGLRLCLL